MDFTEPKSSCQLGYAFSGDLEGNPFPCFLQLLDSFIPWLMASFSIFKCNTLNFSFHHHISL